MADNEPKISAAEGLLLLSYIGATDVAGILLLLGGMDDFFILDLLTFPVTQVYFKIKGVKGNYALIANGLELIPYVGALPIRTVGVAATIWADWHPDSAVGKIASAATIKQLPFSKKHAA